MVEYSESLLGPASLSRFVSLQTSLTKNVMVTCSWTLCLLLGDAACLLRVVRATGAHGKGSLFRSTY